MSLLDLEGAVDAPIMEGDNLSNEPGLFLAAAKFKAAADLQRPHQA